MADVIREHIDAGATSTLWRSMFYFNIYRLVLSCILLVLALGGDVSTGGAHRYPDLFLLAAGSLITLSALYFVTINIARPPFQLQVHLQTILDLLLLAVLIHASEGIQSGFGILMIVTVAAVSLMDTRRSAIAYAALGTLLALTETMIGFVAGLESISILQNPGFLGVGLFTTALVVSQLSQRIRVSEEMVSRRESALADLNALNREIVELIPTGAMAIDTLGRILLCNGRARSLLHLEENPEGRSLISVSLPLYQRLDELTGGEFQHLQEIQFEGNSVQLSTESFGGGRLVFLEDLSKEREQARQVRLAALGRLAAAIAHEIRNPLSAVYQSAQLLRESTTLTREDAEIAAIIHKQSERIERIIASVLVVSRGDPGNPEAIELRSWLVRFVEQFRLERDLDPDAITVTDTSATVHVDPGHLTQVLINLCDNALAHATRERGELIRLSCEHDRELDLPTLQIIDFGRGIPDHSRRQLFEPFFTTRSQGTGLGLYISRELCEANHARLTFESDRSDTVFKIIFHNRPISDAETGAGH
jgi:two-component system, NtrC family, sensor histidine kinase PilS